MAVEKKEGSTIGLRELIKKLKDELILAKPETGKELFDLDKAEVEVEVTVSKDKKGGISFKVLSGEMAGKTQHTHKIRVTLLPATLHMPGGGGGGPRQLTANEHKVVSLLRQLQELRAGEGRMPSDPERITISLQLEQQINAVLSRYGLRVTSAVPLKARQIGGDDVMLSP